MIRRLGCILGVEWRPNGDPQLDRLFKSTLMVPLRKRALDHSGIIARNAHSEVLVSRASIHPNVGTPFATEAIAYLWA
ncbi:hypothetical protein Goshw_030275, partial [Gossypium schwendimanii]|nr:hypothetical protein [Gossypium schwendimanii]MBA0879377.1 hypothetical protein [Gossypium schwendimanii]